VALSDLPRHGRLIASEHIAAITHWKFAGMNGEHDTNAGASVLDAQALRDAQLLAHQEGFAAGRADGLAEAQARWNDTLAAQMQETSHRLAALLSAAQTGLAASQQEIARGTLEIACALARQVVRHELSVNSDSLQGMVHEALAVLLTDTKSARVRLSLSDHAMLASSLATQLAGQAITVVADPELAPGDCLVDSAGVTIDATVATRWSHAVASLGLAVPWEDASHAA
jgi:flagellar assembly protein FliH